MKPYHSPYDEIVARQNRRLLWQAILGLALAIGAMTCICVGADKPALKLRMLPDGRLEVMPDLPTGTRYKLVAAEPTASGNQTWATYVWVIGNELGGGSYVLPFRIDGQPGPNPQPEPGPIPNPIPNPTPDPQPQPSGVVAVYVVHESGDSTPATAAVRDAKAWKDALDKRGVRWLVADCDALTEKLPNVAAKAKALGLPAVVCVYKDGTGVASKMPATPEAMRAFVEGLK